jgi:DNA-directed RNA polymerase subunit RPC12/RpoP
MRCGKEYPAYNRFVMSFPRFARTRPNFEVKCEECGHKFMIDKPIGWWSSKSRRMYNPKVEILHTIGYCSRCKSDQFLLLLHRVDTFVLS